MPFGSSYVDDYWDGDVLLEDVRLWVWGPAGDAETICQIGSGLAYLSVTVWCYGDGDWGVSVDTSDVFWRAVVRTRALSVDGAGQFSGTITVELEAVLGGTCSLTLTW